MNDTHVVYDQPKADPNVPLSHRCDNCGALMPEDVGAWIVTIDGNSLALLCSRRCEDELAAAEPPELLRRLLDDYLARFRREE